MESVLCCDQIKHLVGENVKVNLRGPESRVGVLVSLGENYLTLQLPHGELVYYQLKHVKSLVKKVKESKSSDCYSSYFCSDEDTFIDVLRELKYKWVKINRGGPECVEGLLSDIHDGNITLVNGHEVIYVIHSHVKSVSQIVKNKKNEEE
ncbi:MULTISPECIES: spore coat protein [Bacillus]|uniref:Spore coat protein n=1 Tax=Bacillus cereus TaxID=1396 RepID=A0A2A8IR98_BACCE|nr:MULTISPECIES: spore coat protein [Bacillus]MDH4422784.1 spore coat protein [Bacillus cereus]PER21711.1 spore coat protein [Bacillus cereus]PFA58741.1 spore coat protein [Bacillus sp. AFS015896]PGL80675.1 spore coat protein [Bacillus sp. AFS054943]PGU04640.1 spore coat protein [Bacillus cereus]